MKRAPATAKLNLALVVGPLRDGKHELTTVYQRLDLADRVALASVDRLRVTGFSDDTLVRRALEDLAAAAGVPCRWEARLTKRIPVAAGLGGGSSDAATALRLANETLERPLPAAELHALAAALGADVPFFLSEGPQLGEDDSRTRRPLERPEDYWVVVVLPCGPSPRRSPPWPPLATRRAKGCRNRRASLKGALDATKRARDLAQLPTNDLESSPLANELLAHGAFRADVTGAGPVVYGLFQHLDTARAAKAKLQARGRTWLTAPAWYG
jgi:4-diphosphocytidyl-2-C-methyl-D-erythritol kinase